MWGDVKVNYSVQLCFGQQWSFVAQRNMTLVIVELLL